MLQTRADLTDNAQSIPLPHSGAAIPTLAHRSFGIGGAPRRASLAPARGGLSPRTLRRVRDHIDLHLEKTITLEALAAIAGLSMFHFARAFTRSEGATPHSYLVQRRVGRAQQLLTDTDLSLSEIALASGFSDQSHFARRFREHAGVSPRTFRWAMR